MFANVFRAAFERVVRIAPKTVVIRGEVKAELPRRCEVVHMRPVGVLRFVLVFTQNERGSSCFAKPFYNFQCAIWRGAANRAHHYYFVRNAREVKQASFNVFGDVADNHAEANFVAHKKSAVEVSLHGCPNAFRKTSPGGLTRSVS